MASTSTAERTQSAPPIPAKQTSPFIFWVGVLTIVFVAGNATADFGAFPYPQLLAPAFRAARAVRERFVTTSDLRNSSIWHDVGNAKRGVVKNIPERAFAGYTFYTSTDTQGATLIDMEGNVVHRWHLNFREAWTDAPHVPHPVPEQFIYWRRGHLYPNGDVLAIYSGFGDTPWGYGLIKVDRNSKLIWKYADRVHHDLHVDTDGTIYTLSHDWRDTVKSPIEGMSQLNEIVLDDYVVQLSPEGELQKRISLLDAFARSPSRHLLTPVDDSEWDPLHTNTIEVITPEFAAHHPFLKAGQVLVSCRDRDALAVLDLETESIVWATCGPYRRQHDPDLLPNGNILLFDNRGNAGPGGPSRILEIDPISQAIVWSYTGDESNSLYSRIRSCQQPLPNDNVLITESDGCRLLEVTRAGEVVWEYRNPAQLENDANYASTIFSAARFTPESLSFPLEKNGETVATANRANSTKNEVPLEE
ncbi:MAG: hypothetical protein KDA60_14410 [Planctomycetales bacterium]|nr:hypothetical protein [Planctomycetales bacterium]